MTDAPDLIVPAVNRSTNRFADPDLMGGIVAAIAEDPTLREQLVAAVGGSGGGGVPGVAPVAYRSGNGTAADAWEVRPDTPWPVEWRGMLPAPTAADGYRDFWDTYRRVDVARARPATQS